jgi:hypothetical protein
MDPSHKSLTVLPQAIPSELIGRIVEELVERDRPDYLRLSKDAETQLKQCALVNHTFLLHSQQHLFWHMDLDGEQCVSRAVRILQASDRLCDRIKSIALDCFVAASNLGILKGKSAKLSSFPLTFF